MTDPTNPLPPPQNLALIKAVTAGLGLLLVGGVALLGVLLVTKEGPAELAAQTVDSAPDYVVNMPLAAGERLVSVASGPSAVILHIEDPAGAARLVVLHEDGRTGEIRVAP